MFLLHLLYFLFILPTAAQDPNKLRVEMGGRIHDLFSGHHFDDLLKDVPDPMRPPSVVIFYSQKNSECYSKYQQLDFKNRVESDLPAIERLMAAKYNIDLHIKRHWHSFTPEMNLPQRFGVTKCPSIVFVPRKCNGWTKWCFPNDNCTNFIEQCSNWLFWNGNGDWVTWVNELIEIEGEPKISFTLGSYETQGKWIKERALITSETHVRNSFLSPAMPRWTDKGVKLVKIPDNLYKRLITFYNRFKTEETLEAWDTWSSSQLNFHEVPTKLVSLDSDFTEQNNIAKFVLQPLLEEWCQCRLKFNAFYGFREYQEGSWLRSHVDRIDTHTISATLTLTQSGMTEPWPLQGIDHNGNFMKYEHPPKTMIFYESSTVIHGRPWRSTGNHLGCFIHFSPLPNDEYEKNCTVAKHYAESFKKYVKYKSMPTKEPEYPEFHKMNGMENSREEVELEVTFTNNHNRELGLFWRQDSAMSHFQGSLMPGESFIVYTYHGHQFIWSDVMSDSVVIAPLAKDCQLVIIDHDKNVYYSNANNFEHMEL